MSNQYHSKQDVGYYLLREGPNLAKPVSFVPINPFELTAVAMASPLSPYTRTSVVTKPRQLGFFTHYDGEVSLGPLGNTTSQEACKQCD